MRMLLRRYTCSDNLALYSKPRFEGTSRCALPFGAFSYPLLHAYRA